MFSRRLGLGALVLAGAVAAPLLADDVLLRNGRAFEGVVARVEGERVTVRLPGGVIVLPLAQVERVETRASAFADYLARRDRLRRDGAGATAWLELARWAKAHDLPQGAREAALVAADLEPGLPGLAPLLRGYGYLFDDELERWIPYDDAMRRRGFVQVGGGWLTRQEAETRRRAEQEERALAAAEREALRAAHLERLTREMELQVARLELERASSAAVALGPYFPPYGFAAPIFVLPGFFAPLPPAMPRHPRPGHGREEGPRDLAPPPREAVNTLDLFVRQPGSLFPARDLQASRR